MTLSIVILSYNTPDLISQCISSIKKIFLEELEEKEIEIIVVDNGSEKENISKLESRVSGLDYVKLVKSRQNLGFSKGCNLGAEKSNGDFILFLNSDTQILDKGFLEMANYLKENSDVAIVGAKLINNDKSLQNSVGKFYGLLTFFLMLFGLERVGLTRTSPKILRKVDWVSGACLMVNKEIFNKIGKFDENIFMYAEDMELSYRAKKLGYKTYFYPQAEVVHRQHGSSNRTFAVLNIYKGILYFYKKHKSIPEFQIVSFFLWLKALGVYLLGRITNNNYYTNTYGQALKLFKK